MAVCLAAVFSIYEQRRLRQRHQSDWVNIEANHPVVNLSSSNDDKFTRNTEEQSVVTLQQPTIIESHNQSVVRDPSSPLSVGRRNSDNLDSPPIWEMDCYLAIITTM